jgi:hypothetical protein
MLVMVVMAIAVVWALAALVVVGLCISAARADDQTRTAAPAGARLGRAKMRLIA